MSAGNKSVNKIYRNGGGKRSSDEHCCADLSALQASDLQRIRKNAKAV
jgi:hypothetical protein